jgi:uncharacterized membrane protein
MSGYGYGFPTIAGRADSGDGTGERGIFGSLMEGVGLQRNGSSTGSTKSHKKKRSTTSYLAEQHGIRVNTKM